MGCFVSCRISTDKRVARFLCHSRATCITVWCYAGAIYAVSMCLSVRLFIHLLQISFLLKQLLKLIDCLRATCWTPPDYWQTDSFNGLLMVIFNYHWLNSASRVLKSTCSAQLVQTGECLQMNGWTHTHAHTQMLRNVLSPCYTVNNESNFTSLSTA